ncbi:hypothetical protein TNCV_166811, partial [Trichonephila clavipes]
SPVVVVSYPTDVGKRTPGTKDLVAQVFLKSSFAQPSDASRRQPDKQEDERGWQGGNSNTEEKSFQYSRTLLGGMSISEPRQGRLDSPGATTR